MWVKNGPFSEKNPKNAEQDNKWLIYGFSLNTRFIRNVLYCNKIQHQSARGQGVATSCVCDAEKSHCFFASLGLFVLFLCDPHESLKTQNLYGAEKNHEGGGENPSVKKAEMRAEEKERRKRSPLFFQHPKKRRGGTGIWTI